MRGLRVQHAGAIQAVDHGGGLALQAVDHIAIAVGGRVRHPHVMVGQVLHQAQVEGKLLERQALEQREHIGALIGGDEVIGVLDAAAAPLHFGQGAQVQRLQESAGLVEGDLCVYRHARIVGGREPATAV